MIFPVRYVRARYRICKRQPQRSILLFPAYRIIPEEDGHQAQGNLKK